MRPLLWPALLLTVSTVLRAAAYSQTPFANGWDGYFYLVQLRAWVETGRMHTPEASLIYPLLWLIYRLCGDYVVAFKLGSALLAGLFTASAAYIAGKRQPLAAPLIGTFFLFSPQLTYFAAQYPKNLLGLVLLLPLLYVGSGAPVRSKMAMVAALLILNYFGHRLCFALGCGYVGLWLAGSWRFEYLRKWLPGVVLLVLCILVAGSLLPGLLHISDFERLRGVFSGHIQFPVWSFVQAFAADGRLSGWWAAEIALVSLLLPVYWILKATKKLAFPLDVLAILCTVLLCPLLEWSFTGLSQRLLMVFLLLTPLLGMALPLKKNIDIALCAVLTGSAVFSRHSYNPALHDPDYEQYARITNRAAQHLRPHNAELVIAHHSLAEYFTFSTGTDAMPWLPEYPVDSTRLWRLAAGMYEKNLLYHAGSQQAAQVWNLGGRYFLLPEYVWQGALRHARAENDAIFLGNAGSWLNPAQQRPQYLLRKKVRE